MPLTTEQITIVRDIRDTYAVNGMPSLLGVALGYLENEAFDPWNRTGDGGTSVGIFQIHLPAHGGPAERWLGIEGTRNAMQRMMSRWLNAYAAMPSRFETDPALFLHQWWKPAQGGSAQPSIERCRLAIDRARAALREAEGSGDQIMIPEPSIQWVGANANNFERGRGDISLEAVVLHLTEGGMPGPWFNDPRARASTNYAVSKTGRIEQYVALADTAYAHGIVEVAQSAARPLIQANWGINPNLWAASIEFEGTTADVQAGRVPTPAQKVAAVHLTAWLFATELFDPAANARPLPSRETILMHRDISPRSRTCPVWSEQVHAETIAAVQEKLRPAPKPDPKPDQTTALLRESIDLHTLQSQALRQAVAAATIQADNIDDFIRKASA